MSNCLTSLRRDRSLLQAGLVLLLTIVSVLSFAPPAAASVAGPYRRYCTVHGRQVAFDFWIGWNDAPVRFFLVDRVSDR